MTFFLSFVKKITQEFGQDCFFFSLTEEVQLQRRDGRFQVLCACLVLKKCKTIPCWRKTFFILEKKVILEVFLHDYFSAFVSSDASLTDALRLRTSDGSVLGSVDKRGLFFTH